MSSLCYLYTANIVASKLTQAKVANNRKTVSALYLIFNALIIFYYEQESFYYCYIKKQDHMNTHEETIAE